MAAQSWSLPATAPLTSLLMPVIQSAMNALGYQPRELTVGVFSQGPGSFTGLRVAAAVMRMLHSTTGCAVVGVPTFEAIAAEGFAWLTSSPAPSVERLVILTPARAGFVFCADYCRDDFADEACLETRAAPEIRAIADLRETLKSPVAVIADARVSLEATHADDVVLLPPELAVPRALRIAELGLRRYVRGAILKSEQILPLYIRRPECEEVYDIRRAEARSRRGE